MRRKAAFSILALALPGCMTTDQLIEQMDYSCINLTIDGPTTDSSASGRGIKVPDGIELTPALLETICPQE
jgi:hypothetical protein